MMRRAHTAKQGRNDGTCGWESVLLHAQVLPNYGSWQDNLDGMENNARRYSIKAWKIFMGRFASRLATQPRRTRCNSPGV